VSDRPRYDVVCLGHALVDVIADVDDRFIEEHQLAHGTMSLIDSERAEALYAAMPPAIESSGGSAANTAVGVATLGGAAAYIGKVNDDQLGRVFEHDIRAASVAYEVSRATGPVPTGRSLVMVTPDAQRTMSTFIGISSELTPGDIDISLVAQSRVLYLEGYMWDDPPPARRAFFDAAEAARHAGRTVALTLSDPFVVDRYRTELTAFIKEQVDILFANEVEVVSLYETDSFERAAERVRGDCRIAALTRSEKGCVVIAGEETHAIPAERVGPVVDTTGAGDLFAAGFLYGFTRDHGLDICGRLGVIAAGEVISHYGARPEAPLRDLVRTRLQV
jgi:sugar/nucleoside kinase (ribokinase family)